MAILVIILNKYTNGFNDCSMQINLSVNPTCAMPKLMLQDIETFEFELITSIYFILMFVYFYIYDKTEVGGEESIH